MTSSLVEKDVRIVSSLQDLQYTYLDFLYDSSKQIVPAKIKFINNETLRIEFKILIVNNNTASIYLFNSNHQYIKLGPYNSILYLITTDSTSKTSEIEANKFTFETFYFFTKRDYLLKVDGSNPLIFPFIYLEYIYNNRRQTTQSPKILFKFTIAD